jgi:hypothetical protein
VKTHYIPVLLVVTVFLTICSSASSGVRLVGPSDRVLLRTGNNSVTVAFESLRVPFKPADYKTGDTIRFVLEDTTGKTAFLQLLAPRDTLELRPADTVIWVSMITVSDTVLCKFVYVPIQPASQFIELLRRYSVFDQSGPGDLFAFTYCDASDSSLVSLRTQFRLDSIAGDGCEMTRITNLLHWVHTTLRHDGNVEVPQGYRVATLLARPPAENHGVNCGVLAEVMNEVFLAAGFKSRRIVCLPYDTSDVDCHSINTVWSERDGKWLYVDPTFEGTFRNAKGEYLSIAEVREAMVRGDSLAINNDLNWNGQPHDRAAYFRYIAKNLFRFACISHSGPASGEQRTTMHRVSLNPSGYSTTPIGETDATGQYTGNVAAFWEPPAR